MSPQKKVFRRWSTVSKTEVREVEAFTIQEARMMFDAKYSHLVDQWETTEFSDVQEIAENT